MSVWRSPVLISECFLIMKRICDSNPKSNILSASSNTKNLQQDYIFYFTFFTVIFGLQTCIFQG